MRTATVLESWLAIAQVSIAPPSAGARPRCHRCLHLLAPVADFGKVDSVMYLAISCGLDANQRHPSSLTARIDLQNHGLESALFHPAIFETNHEWSQAMHHRSATHEQEPRPFRATRHERLLAFVENKDHTRFPFRALYRAV
jgi:hypothetical protein